MFHHLEKVWTEPECDAIQLQPVPDVSSNTIAENGRGKKDAESLDSKCTPKNSVFSSMSSSSTVMWTTLESGETIKVRVSTRDT